MLAANRDYAFMSEEERINALVAFQRRSVALGNSINPGRHWRTDLCASLAGSFALAINKGERLTPQHTLTDRECALLWIGFVAADAASHKIGEGFGKGALPIWLFEAGAVERGPQFLREVQEIHERIISGPAAGLATGIANAFLDWTLLNDNRGIKVLEQHIEDTIALVSRQRC
jgi:hypothetical protein